MKCKSIASPAGRRMIFNINLISDGFKTLLTCHFLKIAVKAVLKFNNANFCPIQFLGPALKGAYANGCLASVFSGKNLSGSNTSGSSQTSGSWCN